MLTAERLRELLDYDPATGVFRWRRAAGRWGRIPAGSVAGYRHDGYVMVTIDGVDYRAHRLAWLHVHGVWPSEIDHRDLSRANNAFDNLRECSRSQNCANRGLPRNNTSGVKGVSWYAPLRKWRASIKSGGKIRHIGYFSDPDEAEKAYIAAANRLHGVFARPARSEG